MLHQIDRENQAADTGKEHMSHVKDLFPSNPGWIIRHGMLIFLCVMICLCVFTMFIRYPVVIKATGRLISVNPPKEIMTPGNARMTSLFATEGKIVHQFDILAVLENDARPEDIINLSAMLDSMAAVYKTDPFKLPSYLQRNYAHLGELQAPYEIFLTALQAYCDYIPGGYYFREAGHVRTGAGLLTKLADNNRQQQNLLSQDIALAEANFHASTLLHDECVIPDAEYRVEKSKLINKHLIFPSMQASLLNLQISLNDKSRELHTLQNKFEKQGMIFRQALAAMLTAVESWKKKYLLTAPTDGIVHFLNHAEQGMVLSVGQVLCYVFPPNTSYFIDATISPGNYGGISQGQKVLLTFPAFDYHEFGTLTGTVSFVSKIIDSNAGMKITVSLPAGLHTNYDKMLVHYEGMQADLQIITANKRLSSRLFQGLGDIIRK